MVAEVLGLVAFVLAACQVAHLAVAAEPAVAVAEVGLHRRRLVVLAVRRRPQAAVLPQVLAVRPVDRPVAVVEGILRTHRFPSRCLRRQALRLA